MLKLTRRAMMAGAIATVPPAALAADPVPATDPHPAWFDQLLAVWAHEDGVNAQSEALYEALPEELRRPRVQVGWRRGPGDTDIPMWSYSADNIDKFIDRQINAWSVFGPAFADLKVATAERRRVALKAELAARETEQDEWLRARGFHDIEGRAAAARTEARRLRHLIVSTPAKTLAGMAAQARLLLISIGDDEEGPECDAARGLAASLGVTKEA